jgi:transcriptional regulator with GAF, ATPase, and Fis domain
VTLLLLAPSEVDLKAVAGVLAAHALETVAVPLDAVDGERAPPVDRAALILPWQGVVAIGEPVSRVRRYLGRGVPLLVSCPLLKPADRKEVLACGASALLTPASWRGAAIAERILAELIALGDVQPSSLGSLRGATEPMRRLYEDIATVAPLAESALILGETGTGKELVAREVHRASGRPGSLMAINCAALTPELLESELFGHERGAFSGAVNARKGLLAEAGPGTVFLDEIGDLAPPAQAKLLRVLEERKVRPVGSNRWHDVHARILLATHCDLVGASASGAFRQDLFERIRGFTLRLPPLRERLGDLVLLCSHFVDEYNRDYPGARFVPEGSLDPLFRHRWPGNVRELRQSIRRAAAFADGESGPISALSMLEAVHRGRPATAPSSIPFDAAADTWRAVQDRARNMYFRSLLREAAGNKELARQRSGLGKSQFYETLKQVGVESSEPEEGDED